MAGRHAGGALPVAAPDVLLPAEVPVIPAVPLIPAATSPWAGDWFAWRPGTDKHAAGTPVSVAVLPGGTVHTWGTVMSQARDLAEPETGVGEHPNEQVVRRMALGGKLAHLDVSQESMASTLRLGPLHPVGNVPYQAAISDRGREALTKDVHRLPRHRVANDGS